MYNSLHGNQAEGYTFGAPALSKRMPKYITSATFTKTCQLMHTFLAPPTHTQPLGELEGAYLCKPETLKVALKLMFH